MSWVAVIAGGATLAGGYLANQGAKDAGKTAAAGADAASREAARQFDTVRGDTAQARYIGDQALGALGGIYGYGSTPPASYGGYGSTPSNNLFTPAQIKTTVPGGSLNIGGQLTQKLGGLGKILDPAASLFGSQHGDEKRNLKAFTAANPIYDLGNGKLALADGTQFNSSQLQEIAGTWYGATYAPDGNQTDWQNRYSTLIGGLPKAQGGNVGQPGTGMTSDGVPQGMQLSANQGMAPNGQPVGPGGESMDPNSPNYGAFFKSPDYQFRQQQGLEGIGNSFSASGGAKSGNALKALANFNSNLAAGEFGNYFNRQAALAGIGQTATGQSAGAGIATGQVVGNALQNSADARASGIAGGANAWGSALSGVGQGLGYYLNQRKQPNPYGNYNAGGFGPANVYGG